MKEIVCINFFCSTCLKKIIQSKKIMTENYKKSRRFVHLIFRSLPSFGTLCARQNRMPNGTSTIFWQSSLKISTQYLQWFRRRYVDKPTLWKLLKRQNLKTGRDVINLKKKRIRFGWVAIRSESFIKIGRAVFEKSRAQNV